MVPFRSQMVNIMIIAMCWLVIISPIELKNSKPMHAIHHILGIYT